MLKSAEEIVTSLTKRGETIAIAESITGGGISSALTDVPGTSHVFLGAVVAYTVDIKIKDLGVRHETISEFGVVSEAVAFEMAEGIRARYQSTWAISSTGVAGPGPSHGIPAGTVWIAIIGPGRREALALSLAGDRDGVRRAAISSALATLERILLSYS
jgi:nicotinamide-nucleotide amidase